MGHGRPSQRVKLTDAGRSVLEVLVRKRKASQWDVPRAEIALRAEQGEATGVIALACEPAEENGRTTPTLDELVTRAQSRGIVDPISRRHLKRILDAGDLHPHRVRQWLHRPDPKFREKANEICELYRKPLPGSVVLSIDEKTGIQAIERKGPGLPLVHHPWGLGQPEHPPAGTV